MAELFDAPAMADVPAVVQAQEDRLLETVLASGNIEVLERFIALRKSEQERQAKIAFDERFALMQRELPPVIKTKFNPATKSYYAPLEELQKKWDPVLFHHGFTYSWREELIFVDGKEKKRTWFDLSQFGHTKSNFFDAPVIKPNGAQNDIQTSGVQAGYGYRYSYRAGVGGRISGEDSDGVMLTIDAELRADLDSIKNASNTSEMMTAYQAAFGKYKDDANKQRLVIGEYNLAKQALIKGGA